MSPATVLALRGCPQKDQENLMPSPFPGMDPFLEHPELFPDLHDSLIAFLRDSLNEALPEPYYASIGSRVWVEASQRPIGPDVKVLRPEVPTPKRESSSPGVAVAEVVATEPITIRVAYEEIREPFLEIYASPRKARLITLIEVLSPTNKTAGSHGRGLYVQKQREALLGQVNLVEIDLLRCGEHTTAVPRDQVIARAGLFDYHVCVHSFEHLGDYVVYPVSLRLRLPVIAIPLLPGDAPSQVDLQALLGRCYETGRYSHQVDYNQPVPAPPLRPDQVAWVEELLCEKGIRPRPLTDTTPESQAP
jgi:hypothetical protein